MDESGGICSNPGCANSVVEMHHIREWAVYQTHDEEHMIVLCPTCHAAVSRGSLRLSDEALYEWKSTLPERWAAVSIPPAGLQKLLLGTVAVTSDHPFAVFDLDSFQSLSFMLDVAGTVLSLSADISDQDGNRLLSMHRNTVSFVHDSVEIEQRPGRVRAMVEDWTSLLPRWAVRQLLDSHLEAEVTRGLPVFDIEVVRRGVVRVSGVWASATGAIVVTQSALASLSRPMAAFPLSLEGAGESTILHVQGPVVLFGLRDPALFNLT